MGFPARRTQVGVGPCSLWRRKVQCLVKSLSMLSKLRPRVRCWRPVRSEQKSIRSYLANTWGQLFVCLPDPVRERACRLLLFAVDRAGRQRSSKEQAGQMHDPVPSGYLPPRLRQQFLVVSARLRRALAVPVDIAVTVYGRDTAEMRVQHLRAGREEAGPDELDHSLH